MEINIPGFQCNEVTCFRPSLYIKKNVFCIRENEKYLKNINKIVTGLFNTTGTYFECLNQKWLTLAFVYFDQCNLTYCVIFVKIYIRRALTGYVMHYDKK